MGIQLDQVVLWGRCLEEYQRMFALSEADLQKSLLDGGGGPASFTAEATLQGCSVIACDPVYAFSAAAIAPRIEAACDLIMPQVRQNADAYVWQSIADPNALETVRMAAMRQFLTDLPAGKAAGRYVEGSVLDLPFPDGQFDLALSSHFLLSYSTKLGLDFHLEAVRELCRVARAVRIFLLLTVSGERSPWVDAIATHIAQLGRKSTIVTVDYEFQKGGNQMLKIT
ncbi:MAG: methyltransferase domain-containing protein [Cyanobacteria bacterium P01_D01_bin.14]